MSSADLEYQHFSVAVRRLNELFRKKFMFRGAIICGVCYTTAATIVLLALNQLWGLFSFTGFIGLVYLVVDKRVQTINMEINAMLATLASLETVRKAFDYKESKHAQALSNEADPSRRRPMV